MTKHAKVMEHLLKYKMITSWEAIQKYRVTRLADTIFKLKSRGWLITTIMCDARDGTRYAKYVLMRAPKNG